jgi:SAM-dependent methyltransferase
VWLRLSPGTVPAIIDGAVPAGARILELGCAVGRITHPLLDLGYEVVAVDNSAEMLEHVHGARTVLADVETLALGERFDVVLLGSHFINSADPDVRRALLSVCTAHARPGGVVLIERYAFASARDLDGIHNEQDGVTFTWHDIVDDGDVFSAAVTYEVEGHSWTQRFSAELLDDDKLVSEAADAGLVFDAWLDEPRKWARFAVR